MVDVRPQRHDCHVYREHPAPTRLAATVQCLWQADSTPSLIAPDGCLDLIVSGERVFVAGPDTGPWRSDIPAGQFIEGIRFKPGTASQVLGVPTDELCDQRPSLTDLWGARGRDVGERLLAGELSLEQVVSDNRLAEPDPAVECLVARLDAGAPRVSAALADLVVGQRQLRRRFTAAVGYGPATYLRVARLRRAVAKSASARDLGSLAFAAGYADQAHFCRECRTLTGTSPGQYFSIG